MQNETERNLADINNCKIKLFRMLKKSHENINHVVWIIQIPGRETIAVIMGKKHSKREKCLLIFSWFQTSIFISAWTNVLGELWMHNRSPIEAWSTEKTLLFLIKHSSLRAFVCFRLYTKRSEKEEKINCVQWRLFRE